MARELRDAPAYMEYASSILAKKEFRAMSLQERGLLYSIRLECWVNKTIPANPDELAAFIGQDVETIKKAFTNRVKHFLRFPVGSSSEYESVDLEIYRQSQLERRKKQSEGGKKGAKTTNSKRLDDSSDLQVTREFLNQANLIKTKQTQSSESGEFVDDDFARDYANYETDSET